MFVDLQTTLLLVCCLFYFFLRMHGITKTGNTMSRYVTICKLP